MLHKTHYRAIGIKCVRPATHVCLKSCGQEIAVSVALQGGPLSPLHSKILVRGLGVQKLSVDCRQLPVEEGEKLVKFKAQRFGLKALW